MRTASRKGRRYVITSPTLFFISHHQFASAGGLWEDLKEAEKDEAKERLKSSRYEKYDVRSHPEMC